MTNRRHLPSPPFATAAVVLAIALLVGCPQTGPTPPPPTPPSQKVFVIFEGPWGFAPDPTDPNFVIAMAPKTKVHHDLFVQASYYQTLESGVYELSMPPRTGPPAGKIIPDVVQAKIDPKEVQRVLADKLERYAVRLPKPEEYKPARRFLSSVGTAPPPKSRDVPAKPWATSISLQYSVGSLTTFELKGNSDNGSFHGFPLQVDTPEINFVIYPLHNDDPDDKCFTHERQTFHDLTKLLGVNLYVDFPESPAPCLDKDPQKPRVDKAQLLWPLLERLGAFADSGPDQLREAGFAPGGWRSTPRMTTITQRLAAFYFFFFGRPTLDCKPPGIVSGGDDS